ncbi:MAG: type II toxin-antitoxin system HicA family toxin [Maricaulaceae bacterium]
MGSGELMKALQAAGWTLVRAKGSHHHFKKPGHRNIITVPHPRRDLPPGLLRDCIRKAAPDLDHLTT